MPKKPTRKLKTYQTSLGFYDQAVAAPSMKAALEAWGASSNLFHQGAAKETDDPDIVAATMASPGVVLRRPVGSDGPFTEHAALPTVRRRPVGLYAAYTIGVALIGRDPRLPGPSPYAA